MKTNQHRVPDVSAIVEADPIATANLIALNGRSAEGQAIAGWEYRNVRDAITKGCDHPVG